MYKTKSHKTQVKIAFIETIRKKTKKKLYKRL